MKQADSFIDEIKALEAVLRALAPLDDAKRQFVLRTVTDRLAISDALPGIQPKSSPTLQNSGDDDIGKMTPKDFLVTKSPKTDVQRVACLAYYLTYGRQQAQFKTSDITQLNTATQSPRFSNAAVSVDNATNVSKLLASIGQGKKQITSLGESVVKALPDYANVREVIRNSHYPRKKRKKSTNKGK